ncbi:MAG: hypothetical protein RLZZ436_1336 [Planctomycetota bacterium]
MTALRNVRPGFIRQAGPATFRGQSRPDVFSRGQCGDSRRGVISLWTSGVLACCGFTAFCVISIWLDCGRLLHAKHATESAALAAAHAWLTDDLLRAGPASFEAEARTIRCKEAAEQALSDYRTVSAALQMGPADPELIWRGVVSPDAVFPRVPAAVRISVPNTLAFTSTGLARLLSGQVPYAASTAALENHPASLCPAPGCSISFLPFAALEGASGLWAQLLEQGVGVDVWAWNADRREFEPGPDGIPEISVELSADASGGGAESGLVPLLLRPAVGSGALLTTHAEVIRSGLTRECLEKLGLAEWKYPSLVGSTTLSSGELSECVAVLAEYPTEPRILSLATVPTVVAAADPPGGVVPVGAPLQVLTPVAVRVASLTLKSDGAASITLQPCILVSAMIRTDSRAPESRCIYSVRLVE